MTKAKPAPKKPTPSGPTVDEVVRDLKRHVAKAIDSGKFVIYIGYTEDDTRYFSEHKSGGMPAGDILWIGKMIASDVSKTFAQSMPADPPRKRRKP